MRYLLFVVLLGAVITAGCINTVPTQIWVCLLRFRTGCHGIFSAKNKNLYLNFFQCFHYKRSSIWKYLRHY
jgi:hypothetical protein